MSRYRIYSRYLIKSVEHIFNNLLNKETVDLVFKAQADKKPITVSIDLYGTIQGEILYYFPRDTIKKIINRMMPSQPKKKLAKKEIFDMANELSNMITGTFVNQMQYLEHEIDVSPPVVQENKDEYIRTLFETVNLSFSSDLGGFDIDFFYKENSNRDQRQTNE